MPNMRQKCVPKSFQKCVAVFLELRYHGINTFSGKWLVNVKQILLQILFQWIFSSFTKLQRCFDCFLCECNQIFRNACLTITAQEAINVDIKRFTVVWRFGDEIWGSKGLECSEHEVICYFSFITKYVLSRTPLVVLSKHKLVLCLMKVKCAQSILIALKKG